MGFLDSLFSNWIEYETKESKELKNKDLKEFLDEICNNVITMTPINNEITLVVYKVKRYYHNEIM